MILVAHTRLHLKLSGHAEVGNHQADCVCAAVSALVATYCKVVGTRRRNPIYIKRQRTAAYRYLLTGLRLLASCYPRNIRFAEDTP
jgi:uncharacterized protein YsxB (DUF464 family)